MKTIILIFFLFFINNTISQEPQLADFRTQKWWRLEIRMPYTGELPCKHRNHGDHSSVSDETKEKSWGHFWSYQVCGYCEKKADECFWLKKMKPNIKALWIKTVSSGQVPVKIKRIGYGIGIQTKTGNVVK